MTDADATEIIYGVPRIYLRVPQELLDRLEAVLAAKLPELRNRSDQVVWAIRQTVEREERERGE